MTAASSPEADEPAAPMSDASTLCVNCGMCCNGVLFTNARAEPDEVARLREHGLVVEQVRPGRTQFRLPCPHHHEGHCGIYSDRFLKCRTFRCALLKRLDEGETSLAEAQATVARAQAMLARVTALDPGASQFLERTEQRAQPAPAGDGEDAARRRRVRIESLALDLFLDRKFRNRKAIVMNQQRRSADEGDR